MQRVYALLILVFLAPSGGFACSFDTDCMPGSKCLKASGSIYGACVGGIFPGNRNDQQPVKAPLDPNNTYGNTCSFDTDCGPSSVCFKQSGSIYGTCLKRR
jgi:hypothetical protein